MYCIKQTNRPQNWADHLHCVHVSSQYKNDKKGQKKVANDDIHASYENTRRPIGTNIA